MTFPSDGGERLFVMTHRDPTDVILSVADLFADIITGFTGDGGLIPARVTRLRPWPRR